MVAQGVLPYQLDQETRKTTLTGLGGLPIYLDLAHIVGLRDSIARHLGLTGASQGWSVEQSEGPDRIAFVGAAQTFGRFRKRPFPRQVGERLGLGSLNLGVGGKGPDFFSTSSACMEALRRSRLVVVQVMSGRSVSNSVFATQEGGRDGARRSDRRVMTAEELYDDLLRGRDPRGREPGFLDELVAETRRNYIRSMTELLRAIPVPTVLFWFSVRSPDQTVVRATGPHGAVDRAKSIAARLGVISRFERIYGQFPHMVDSVTLEQVRPHAEAYVECVSSAGLPEIRFNRTRRRLVWNNYYPSAAMHARAADLLTPVCRRLLR